MLAYSSNVKFSQNLQDRTKFYRTCPSVQRISESVIQRHCQGIIAMMKFAIELSQQIYIKNILHTAQFDQNITETIYKGVSQLFIIPYHKPESGSAIFPPWGHPFPFSGRNLRPEKFIPLIKMISENTRRFKKCKFHQPSAGYAIRLLKPKMQVSKFYETKDQHGS